MNKRGISVCCLFLFASLLPAYADGKDKTQYPHVTVTELIKAAQNFNGRKVVVSGCYVWSFEVSTLFSCEQEHDTSQRIWVEMSPAFEGRKKLKEGGGYYRQVAVLGTFATGGHYGHQQLRHLLSVERVYSMGPNQKFKTN